MANTKIVILKCILTHAFDIREPGSPYLLFLTDGSWEESGTHVLKLGVLPVKALLVVGAHVWASSGGQIFIINTQTHTVEVRQHFQPPQGSFLH